MANKRVNKVSLKLLHNMVSTKSVEIWSYKHVKFHSVSVESVISCGFHSGVSWALKHTTYVSMCCKGTLSIDVSVI